MILKAIFLVLFTAQFTRADCDLCADTTVSSQHKSKDIFLRRHVGHGSSDRELVRASNVWNQMVDKFRCNAQLMACRRVLSRRDPPFDEWESFLIEFQAEGESGCVLAKNLTDVIAQAKRADMASLVQDFDKVAQRYMTESQDILSFKNSVMTSLKEAKKPWKAFVADLDRIKNPDAHQATAETMMRNLYTVKESLSSAYMLLENLTVTSDVEDASIAFVLLVWLLWTPLEKVWELCNRYHGDDDELWSCVLLYGSLVTTPIVLLFTPLLLVALLIDLLTGFSFIIFSESQYPCQIELMSCLYDQILLISVPFGLAAVKLEQELVQNNMNASFKIMTP